MNANRVEFAALYLAGMVPDEDVERKNLRDVGIVNSWEYMEDPGARRAEIREWCLWSLINEIRGLQDRVDSLESEVEKLRILINER